MTNLKAAFFIKRKVIKCNGYIKIYNSDLQKFEIDSIEKSSKRKHRRKLRNSKGKLRTIPPNMKRLASMDL